MSRTATSPQLMDSILDTIGSTPLVRLSRIAAGLRPAVLVVAVTATFALLFKG